MVRKPVRRMTIHRDARQEADQCGQATVEFAFTFVIFTALLIAILGLGWLFFSYASIVNAARDGSHHLMAHPVIPADTSRFATADEEVTWIVTNSLPLLDWTNMTVTASPPPAQRVYGGYVAVAISYTVTLPEFNIPLGFDGTSYRLLGPMQISARSRRNLD